MASSLLGSIGGGREYTLKIIADVKDAVKGVDEVSDKTASFKDKALGIGKGVAAGLAAGAVVAFGKSTIDAAAAADDALDMVDSAFGTASKTITGFAKTAADKMGLSQTAYENMAGKTGQILTGFGISQQQAADQTNVLTQRAADMAAIWGTDVPTAMDAIDKALQGQTKGMKQYGVTIDKTEVAARAMAEGYVDASGKVTDAGKAIATQEILLEKTNKYQGEFAKNSGDLGSQQDILAAKFENVQTTIGNALLPVILKLFDVIQPLMTFIQNNTSWLVPLAAGILGVVAAVKAWNVIQLVLNSTLLANPIFQVVAIITALAAAIIWAYNNVGWFRDAVDAMGAAVVATFNWIKDAVVAVFNWIRDNWPLLLAILAGPFGIAAKLVIDNWDTIVNFFKSLPGMIAGFVSNVWNIISQPFVSAKDAVINAMNVVGNWFRDLPGRIGGWLSSIWNTITRPFNDAKNGVISTMDAVGNWFRDLPGRIGGFFSGLGNAIKAPFVSAFNAIRNLWNSTVGGFGFNVPSWVPGIGGKGFTIPRMATGGIVSKPTIALIGEAGPEAVVPLSQLAAMPTAVGDTVIINVYALTAGPEVGRQVWNALREYERVNGKAPTGS